MPTTSYRRTVDDLDRVASKFWPKDLFDQESEQSAIPRLVQTQDDFLALMLVPVNSVEALFKVINTSSVPANLFLKHLVVLTDFGGEPLQNVGGSFAAWFPQRKMTYLWPNPGTSSPDIRTYQFKALPDKKPTNDSLGISGKKLAVKQPLSDLQKDVIALLLFGASCTHEEVANDLAKCHISEYLGQRDKLETFVRQRYIFVSRITGGAQSNTLGQLAQNTVQAHLRAKLGKHVTIQSNGNIPGIRHTEETDVRGTTFDLVVAHGAKYAAVEISFQVTTNSVIERKSGQARARYEQLDKHGYKIAYILDGAGNFRRTSALKTICDYSHCTVAFSVPELDLLCRFIQEYFAS